VAPNQRFAAAMLNGAATAALFLVSHTSFLVTEAPRFVDGGHMSSVAFVVASLTA